MSNGSDAMIPPDLVDFVGHRSHVLGVDLCGRCGHVTLSVVPVGTDPWRLECLNCGERAVRQVPLSVFDESRLGAWMKSLTS
jgi:hypothetical protein